MSTSDKVTGSDIVDLKADVRKQRLNGARPNGRLLWGGAAAVVVLVVGSLAYGLSGRNGAKTVDPGNAVPVLRGNLTVSVTEGGALVAMKALDLKSEVEGRKSILEIVDEGTIITQEDVDNGKILCKLDAADLEEQISQHSITFYNAEGAYTQAQEDYTIQEKQNESDVTAAELNVKFKRMALDLYLGAELAAQVLDKAQDFAGLAGNPTLGGSAQNLVRDAQSKVQLAEETLTRDTDKLDWTKKLYAKGYAARTDLTADELQLSSSTVEKASAVENLALLRRYTLPKDAEQAYSDYIEATRNLDRRKAQAHSAIAQKESRVKSTQANYELERARLEKARGMLAKCTIRAPKPGQVVYSSSTDAWTRMRNPIKEGTQVWQNQKIITIPDLSTLAARVNIHETDVEHVRIGQRAVITIEALPGKSFTGKVARVSPVASSANAWLNPEIKVYETDVALDGTPEGLTPGMSATTQIITAELTDVVYVPVTAVTTYRGDRVCLVRSPGGPEVRPVETGQFTEKYVEIKSGLRQGEAVYTDPVQTLGERFWELTPEPSQEGLQMIKDRGGKVNGAQKAPGAEATEAPAAPQNAADVQPAAAPQASADVQPAADPRPAAGARAARGGRGR